MKNKKFSMVAFVVMFCVAAAIIGIYYFISNKGDAGKKGLPANEFGRILSKDLNTSYPGSPGDVIEYYNRINKYIYNEKSLNEKDFKKLLTQMRLLYDDEFLEENSMDSQFTKFKEDKQDYTKKGKLIVTTAVQKSSRIQHKELKGRQCATVVTSYLIKEKSEYQKIYQMFLLRKDSGGDWKIMGWAPTTSDVMGETEE